MKVKVNISGLNQTVFRHVAGKICSVLQANGRIPVFRSSVTEYFAENSLPVLALICWECYFCKS